MVDGARFGPQSEGLRVRPFMDLLELQAESAKLFEQSAALTSQVSQFLAEHDERLRNITLYFNWYRGGTIPPSINDQVHRIHNQNLAATPSAVTEHGSEEPAFTTTESEARETRFTATKSESQSDAVLQALGRAMPWMSTSQRHAIAQSGTLRAIPKRRRIAGDVEIRTYFFLIVSGKAKLGFNKSGTQGRLLAILGASDLLGMMAFVEPRTPFGDPAGLSYYCDALTECVVAQIGLIDIIGAIIGEPNAASQFVDHVMGRWIGLPLWQMGLADLNVRGRLLANLRVLAARFGAPFGDGTAIDLSLTESDLAELIGASRPKVSTSLSALIEDGLIRRVRRRLILAQKGENSSISGHSKGTIDALEDTNQ